jgi:hypothetical protein
MLKQLDLSQRSLGQNLLAKNIGDLLYSNTLPCLNVRSRTVVAC